MKSLESEDFFLCCAFCRFTSESWLNLATVAQAWLFFPKTFSGILKDLSVDPGLPDERRASLLPTVRCGKMLENWRRNGHQPSCAVARTVSLSDARRTPAPTVRARAGVRRTAHYPLWSVSGNPHTGVEIPSIRAFNCSDRNWE